MPGNGVALDVADAAFILPPWSGRGTVHKPKGHHPVPKEGVESVVKADLSGMQVVLADQGPRVVPAHLLCRAAKVPERAFRAL
jgi:hypothetical protein